MNLAALALLFFLQALPVKPASSPAPGPLSSPAAAPAARPQLLLVVGAPGAPEYAERFRSAASRWQKAAARGGLSVSTIGLDPAEAPPDRERLRRALASAVAVKDAPLWLVLVGHGTFDGRAARFNLRGPDVTDKELAGWLGPLNRPLIFINTGSASGPFVRALTGPGRIVVTATRTGTEQSAPRFGAWLAEAMSDLRADLDRDGGVSLLEAFLYASNRVEASFAEEGLLATEHALLEDSGDGIGTGAEAYRGLAPAAGAVSDARWDGDRARLVNLIPPPPERALSEPLRRRRDQLEAEVLTLRERRAKLPESAYYAKLERLLLEIARVYQRAEREQPPGKPSQADPGSPPGSAHAPR